ncbi:MAG: SIS domain-containing protein [Paludibacteraceae bacterium]|jgi:arabinose-5-phosphate isomerase|nr:SIS domain-containing protein [Paludibacteraceae bacterium]MCR4619696.1 SIS domain-containing protein [Paludibacteraceae bacterium]
MTKEDIQALLTAEANAVKSLPITEDYQTAIKLIVTHVNEKGGKLVCSGMGKAGQIAMNISTTFSSTGTPSVYLHPAEAQHGDLGLLQPNDLLLLVSNSGKTREIIELVQLTHGLYPDMPYILITGNQQGELVQDAAATLLTGNPPEVCPLGMAPTTSTTMMTVIGDILIVGTERAIGFTKAQYALRHHGGYLGQKSRQ